MSQFQAIKGAI